MLGRTYVRKTTEILEAAERVFLSQGYATTSMTDVAAAAAVSKQTVYSNFASKQDLFAAVIGRRSAVEIDVPEDVDVATGELRTVLVELGVAFLSHIYSRGQVELFQTVVAESRQFPELGELMLKGPFVETPRAIADVISARAESGELRLTCPEEGPAMFTSLLKSDLHGRLIFSQQVDTSPDRIQGIVQRAVDLFLYGAAPEARG